MGAYYELRNADGEVQSLVAEKGGDLESTYRAFLAESSPGRRRQLYSDFMNLILYGDNHGKVAAYVMIPREPQLVKQGLFAVWTENPPDFSVKSRSELPGVIAAFDAKYPIKH